MEKPRPQPPKSMIPTIQLMKWKPDEDALNVAMGKKSGKKNDRGPHN